MAISPGVWAIDNGVMNGNIARLFYKAATRSGNGIVEIGDLLVKPQTAPNGTVAVGAGSAVILGQEVYDQGSYWVDNITDENVTIAPTAGTARNDLLYLRMEDPTFDGSPWTHDPAVDVCASFVVLQGVSAGTEEVPDGVSGVALARIEIPANTSAITSAYIKDVRKMFDPRTHTEQYSLQGVWTDTDSVGNTSTYEQFPNGASFDVDIPKWASQAVVSFTFGGLQYMASGGSASTDPGGTDARGLLRLTLGTLTSKETGYWQQSGPSNSLQYTRVAEFGGDTLNIPVAMRGTTQTFQMEGSGTVGYKGSLQADGWSSLLMTILFREVPVTDEPDRSNQ